MNHSLERVEIPCGEIILQGRLHRAPPTSPGVVICHPHPQFGGNMDNNVVYALEARIAARGISTLCFNFRGVAGSGGKWDEMHGEVDDVIAAVTFLASRLDIDAGRIGLAGYSFGGLMAMYAASALAAGPADALKIKALALISPMPPGIPWEKDKRLADVLRDPPPTLITVGTQDQFCPLQGARSLANEIGMNVRLIVIEGGDHFYAGREDEAAMPAADFFTKVF